MTIEKNIYGAWIISAVVGNQLIRRTYYMYTRREAIRLFREEIRGAK